MKKSVYKEYLPLFIVSFLYISLLTLSVPFFWSDHVNLSLATNEWSYTMLEFGYEFYFRPLENLTYYIFYAAFGEEAIPMRLWKALIVASISILIYYFVKKHTNEKKIAIGAAIFYLTSETLVRSVMWMYDFEVVTQFFLLLATIFFFKAYEESKKIGKKRYIFHLALILFVYAALLTKESAKVFVLVLPIFIFLTDWKKFKYFAISLSLLLLLAVKPGLLIGLSNPSSGNIFLYLFDWFSVQNLILFLKYLMVSSFGVILILIYLLYKYLKEKKSGNEMETKHVVWGESEKWRIKISMVIKNNPILVFFGLWFILTTALTMFVSLTEIRYALVPFLHFVIISFIIMGGTYKKYFSQKKIIAFIFWVLIITMILANTGASIKYRYGHGNFFMTIDETYEFIEKDYTNSTFIFVDSSAHFLNSPNNDYFEYPYLEKMETEEGNVFLISTKGAIQTKEKENAVLVESFVNGPHCTMLYGLGEIDTKILEKDKDGTMQYNFDEGSKECSIVLETRFLFPQEVKITTIGNEQNKTKAIKPPVGKLVSCEYTCPKLDGGEIQAIEVEAKLLPLNRIDRGEIHIQ